MTEPITPDSIKAALRSALSDLGNTVNLVTEEACRLRTRGIQESLTRIEKQTGKIPAIEISLATHLAEHGGQEKEASKVAAAHSARVAESGVRAKWIAALVALCALLTGGLLMRLIGGG